MAYTRFSDDCDVYIYANSRNPVVVECCGCKLLNGDLFKATSYAGMAEHVQGHINAGHKVPDRLVQALMYDEKNPPPDFFDQFKNVEFYVQEGDI